MQVSELRVTDSLSVSGETILSEGLTVEGDSTFAGNVTFGKTLSLSNGLNVTGGDIEADGIDVDLGAGTITASNVVYSLIAGDGIELAGTQEVTVTNADPGSAQKIFGVVKVGDVELTPGDNTDTLTLSAGSGVSLGTNEDENEITVSAANQSGWYKPSDSLVALITNGNNVGLGLAAPTNKLEIDSGSTDTSGLTFTRLTSASTSGFVEAKSSHLIVEAELSWSTTKQEIHQQQSLSYLMLILEVLCSSMVLTGWQALIFFIMEGLWVFQPQVLQPDSTHTPMQLEP